jgi:membrane protein YdbS with pleckstrin-like domain
VTDDVSQKKTPAAEAPAAAPTSQAPTGLDPVPGEWRRVSPKYIVVDLIGTLITGVIMTVASGVPWFIFQLPLFLLLPAFFAVMAIVLAAFTPRRVRSIGYMFREDDLLFRKGIMFQRFVSVPYGRMQLVDINRGPLARAVGLSELKLVTAAAASNITIPGLPEKDAEELRDHLVALAESRRAGL